MRKGAGCLSKAAIPIESFEWFWGPIGEFQLSIGELLSSIGEFQHSIGELCSSIGEFKKTNKKEVQQR